MNDKSGWSVEILGTLTRNPWFGVLLQNVTLPDGSKAHYYTIDFPTSAVGVVVRRDDEFLLIQQYRFIVDEHVWAIPSGGAQVGETVADAAAREMEEETGYRPSKPLEHILGYYPSYGCGNQRFELFLAEDPVRVREKLDTQEVISTRWFNKQELLGMIQRNEIVDGLSLTPLLLLLLRDTLASGCSIAGINV
jgi:8-oxo-dGTP pyrophosphatase MutT (NUDIX family)